MTNAPFVKARCLISKAKRHAITDAMILADGLAMYDEIRLAVRLARIEPQPPAPAKPITAQAVAAAEIH